MTAPALLAVALAGALGALARLAVSAAVDRRASNRRPWGTFAVNASGSLALGAVAGASASAGLSPALELAATGGFLGAYTTFSTWMVQSVELAQRGALRAAAANLAGSTLLGTAAAAAGLLVGRALA